MLIYSKLQINVKFITVIRYELICMLAWMVNEKSRNLFVRKGSKYVVTWLKRAETGVLRKMKYLLTWLFLPSFYVDMATQGQCKEVRVKMPE